LPFGWQEEKKRTKSARAPTDLIIRHNMQRERARKKKTSQAEPLPPDSPLPGAEITTGVDPPL
jgi:hypothetical protein